MQLPKIINTHPKLLFFVVCLLPAIDMINGCLMREAGSNYTFIIKGIVLLYAVLIIARYDKQSIKWIYLSCGISMFFVLIHSTVSSSVNYLYSEISWTVKYLYLYICYRYFRCYIAHNNGSLDLLFGFAFFCLVLNSIISYSGLGYSQYEFGGEQVGSRGLFYAGNELGALHLIVSTYVLYKSYSKNIFIYLLFSSVILFCSSQIASKAAIVGALLLIVLTPLMFLVGNSENIFKICKKEFYKTLVISLFVIFVGGYSVYYVLFKLNLYSRIAYFSEKFDVVTLLFSYRNVWAYDLLAVFEKKSTLINYLFGMSYNIYNFNSLKTVEIDIVDIFIVYGILGVLATYGFVAKCLFSIGKICRSNCSNQSRVLVYLMGIMMVLGLSVTAGHVFNSGIAASYFAGLISLALSSCESSSVELEV